jgi:hypothetical protein
MQQITTLTALLAAGKSVSEAARDLGIDRSTGTLPGPVRRLWLASRLPLASWSTPSVAGRNGRFAGNRTSQD